MNKTIEPYETENFIIHYTDAANLIISAAKYTLLKNREVVEKLGLIFEKEDEEMHFLIADKNFGLVNSFLTKETFKWLENQKQFEKINVIMPNPFGEYSFMVEQLSEDMKDLRKQAKQYQTWIKVKKCN